jgi:Fic family protein
MKRPGFPLVMSVRYPATSRPLTMPCHAFVPPPADQVEPCMADLEQFLHDTQQRTPPLIKAALVHAQFETIHPFLDGNGELLNMMDEGTKPL